MKVRLQNKRGLVRNCETPKAYAVKSGKVMVFVPKSKSMVMPVESSKHINDGKVEYRYYDLIVSNAFLHGKDELIETLRDIYHFNKMYKENVTDIPYYEEVTVLDNLNDPFNSKKWE
jgi:hypothetical protein